jgi:hypothetical protein
LHDAASAATTGLPPGAPAANVRVEIAGRREWLLRVLDGGFNLLVFGRTTVLAAAPERGPVRVTAWRVVTPEAATGADDEIVDVDGKLAAAHGASDGHWLLFRPDQHLVAQGRDLRADTLQSHLRRCTGLGEATR